MLKDKNVYIYNKDLIDHCNKLPSMQNRASIVQDLIESYKLLSQPNVVAVQSQDASEEELKSFHSSGYVDFLKSVNSFDSSLDEIEEEHLEYGLGYDCPVLTNIYDFASCVAGGSLSAAKLLAAKKCRTVLNWFGGWHHAQRDSASGFCYVNDIVIAIQVMSKAFDRILYVDLDIHHGDGVQNAFEYSNKILTLSFHKHCPGFFPNTGSLDDIGMGKGKHFSLNVPLKDGVSDKTFVKMFNEIFPLVLDTFKPKALVVQCGADGLNGDSVGLCNLTLNGYGSCIKAVLDCDLPTLYLGGGGYNFTNAARLWTYLTSLIINRDLENDIPDSSKVSLWNPTAGVFIFLYDRNVSEYFFISNGMPSIVWTSNPVNMFEKGFYFCEYGPSYELHIEAGRRKDCNTPEYLDMVAKQIKSYCSIISTKL